MHRSAELEWREEILARRNNPTPVIVIRRGRTKKISLIRRLLTIAGL
jgi:hypothetical protein